MPQTIALKTSVESVRKMTCDVVVQRYGDGYQQRAANSTSHINETWDIKVPIIERSQFDALQTQLLDIGGDPFYWQPDSSFALDSYVCDRYSFQEEIYAYKTLSATFRRSPKFQYVAILDNTIRLQLIANIDSQFTTDNKTRIQRYRSGSEQRRQDGLNYTFDSVSVVVAKLSRADADELHEILSQLGGVTAFTWEPDGAMSSGKTYVCAEWSFQYVLDDDVVSFAGNFEQVYKLLLATDSTYPATWDKYGSTCVINGCGSGQFSDLSLCLDAAPITRWRCVNGVCIATNSSGYSSQALCEAALTTRTESYIDDFMQTLNIFKYYTGANGTSSATIQGSGGNPTTYRQHTLNIVGNGLTLSTQAEFRQIATINGGAALQSLNLAIDVKPQTSGNSVGISLAIIQNGILYTDSQSIGGTTWQTANFNNLVASNFSKVTNFGSNILISPTGNHPDFTSTLELGYLVSSSNSSPSFASYSNTFGIDNPNLTVTYSACP